VARALLPANADLWRSGAPFLAAFARSGDFWQKVLEGRLSRESRLPYNPSVLILISAGEASGEMYGAQLIEALRRAYAHVGTAALGCPADRRSAAAASTELGSAGHPWAAVPTFFGVGSDRMRAAGCDTVVDAKDLSVVGITEILSHLPKIWGLFQHLIREADRRKPDLAIVIDSPAFNWRVARAMKKRAIPTVYYVAPQFWAWRQGRVRLLRDYIDKALVIFPFEEKFYRDRGVDATFVGHPLADLPYPAISREDYAKELNLNPSKQWITLMPGSRVKEVRMNLPTILESAAMLGDNYGYLLPVAPTLGRDFLMSLIRGETSQALKRDNAKEAPPARVNSHPSQIDKVRGITLVPESLPALYHSRAGIIASGTATVEAAMMNTPFVMVYRVSPLTYLLGKPHVKVPRFAMVNLIAGEGREEAEIVPEIVPELVQHDFTAPNVVGKLKEILSDGPARTRMIDGLARVKALLRAPATPSGTSQHPADRAAEIILNLKTPLETLI
jgi:lipid-A-disaccharide synthase